MSTELKFMSFNIRTKTILDCFSGNSWKQRRKSVVDTILRYDPDIVGLQEVQDCQYNYILRKLPEYLSFGSEFDDKTVIGGEYCPIFYKSQKLISFDRGFIDISGGLFLNRHAWGRALPFAVFKVRGQDKTVAVVNAHLHPWSNKKRIAAAKLISKTLSPLPDDTVKVVLGDFNFDANSITEPRTAVKRVLGRSKYNPASAVTPYSIFTNFMGPEKVHLLDTYKEYDLDRFLEGGDGTYHKFKGYIHGPRIDWILCSLNANIKEAGIIRQTRDGSKKYPSDHFPVVAKLEI